jgi:hypothetical protein
MVLSAYETRVGGALKSVRLVTFPRDDAAFDAHVRRARDAIGTADSYALADRIRAAYPRARATIQIDRTSLYDLSDENGDGSTSNIACSRPL